MPHKMKRPKNTDKGPYRPRSGPSPVIPMKSGKVRKSTRRPDVKQLQKKYYR